MGVPLLLFDHLMSFASYMLCSLRSLARAPNCGQGWAQLRMRRILIYIGWAWVGHGLGMGWAWVWHGCGMGWAAQLRMRRILICTGRGAPLIDAGYQSGSVANAA
jgi:hypothetical protein